MIFKDAFQCNMLLEQHFTKYRPQMACYTDQFLVQHLLFSKPSLAVVPGNREL